MTTNNDRQRPIAHRVAREFAERRSAAGHDWSRDDHGVYQDVNVRLGKLLDSYVRPGAPRIDREDGAIVTISFEPDGYVEPPASGPHSSVVAEVSDALQADGINVIIEAYNACIACVYSFAPEDNA